MKKVAAAALWAFVVVVSCTSAHAQTLNPAISQYHNNLRVTIAGPNHWPEPRRWSTAVTYELQSQPYQLGMCARVVLPYGSAIPNGPIGFPGNPFNQFEGTGTLGYKCYFELWEGQCLKVNLVEYAEPNLFGHRYVVQSMGNC